MLTGGNKTAAEKVVRRFESCTDLESPDKRESNPFVTDVQDSPLSKFLCDLSPIQPAKSVRQARTHNELTFPPESRVFASPHIVRGSSSSALKRVVAAERFSVQAQVDDRENLTWQSDISGSTLSDNSMPPSPLSQRSDDHQVTPFPRRPVEEVPASQPNSTDLVDEGTLASNSMQLNSESTLCKLNKMVVNTTSRLQSQLTDYQQPAPVASATMTTEIDSCIDPSGGNNGTTNTAHIDVAEGRLSTSSLSSQANDCVVSGIKSQESSTGHDNQNHASMISSSHNEYFGLNCSPNAKGSPELDQDTAAMAYFLAGNRDPVQESGFDDWSEDSIEVEVARLPSQPTSGHTDNQSDMINGGSRKQGSQVLDAVSSFPEFRLSCEGRREPESNSAALDASHDPSLVSERTDTFKQRGLRRRCLDFDVARRTNFGITSGRKFLGSKLKDSSGSDGNNTSSVLNDVAAASSEATTNEVQAFGDDFALIHKPLRTEVENGKCTQGAEASACGDTLGPAATVQQLTSSCYQNQVDVAHAKTGESHAWKSHNSGVTGTINPSECVRRSPRAHKTGIGLHLNSLTSSMSFKRVYVSTPDCTALNTDNFGTPLGESLSLHSVVSPRGRKRPRPDEEDLVWQREGEANGEFLDSPESCKNRRLSRRKSSSSYQVEKPGDGCKRCNCKKSKCLKLYCECFAARIFCVGSCACRNCFNKPEHEATVLHTRQQIEARDPLAFAPKIVQGAESTPVSRDDALDTPAMARHKRGCNCKKSLCLKKYCECYQAGVGCSEGCRCEGCKNMYGRKEGSEGGEEKEVEHANSTSERSRAEDTTELFKSMSGKNDQLSDHENSNLPPITPTFARGWIDGPMPRLRSPGRNHASDEQFASPLAQQLSRPPNSPTRFLNTLNSCDFVPYTQEDTDFSINDVVDSQTKPPKFARIGPASSDWGGLSDFCPLTPPPSTTLDQTPGSPRVTVARSSAYPTLISQISDSFHRTTSATNAHHHSSGRKWSPHTPEFRQSALPSPLRPGMPHQAQLSGTDQLHPPLVSTTYPGTKLRSEAGPVTAPDDDDDDGTPDFLKHADVFASLTRRTLTKSSSPKQKRITPPQDSSREQASFGGGRGNPSATPPGLRNTKKFILQALPPLPSDTSRLPNG